MRRAAQGQSGPASAALNHNRTKQALDRELVELEKKKLVQLTNGSIRLTRAGYLELVRRFPRRPSMSRRRAAIVKGRSILALDVLGEVRRAMRVLRRVEKYLVTGDPNPPSEACMSALKAWLEEIAKLPIRVGWYKALESASSSTRGTDLGCDDAEFGMRENREARLAPSATKGGSHARRALTSAKRKAERAAVREPIEPGAL